MRVDALHVLKSPVGPQPFAEHYGIGGITESREFFVFSLSYWNLNYDRISWVCQQRSME